MGPKKSIAYFINGSHAMIDMNKIPFWRFSRIKYTHLFS